MTKEQIKKALAESELSSVHPHLAAIDFANKMLRALHATHKDSQITLNAAVEDFCNKLNEVANEG